MEYKVFETKTMKAYRDFCDYWDDEDINPWFWEIVSKKEEEEILFYIDEECIDTNIKDVDRLLDFGKFFVKEGKAIELYNLLWEIKNFVDGQKIMPKHTK